MVSAEWSLLIYPKYSVDTQVLKESVLWHSLEERVASNSPISSPGHVNLISRRNSDKKQRGRKGEGRKEGKGREGRRR